MSFQEERHRDKRPRLTSEANHELSTSQSQEFGLSAQWRDTTVLATAHSYMSQPTYGDRSPFTSLTQPNQILIGMNYHQNSTLPPLTGCLQPLYRPQAYIHTPDVYPQPMRYGSSLHIPQPLTYHCHPTWDLSPNQLTRRENDSLPVVEYFQGAPTGTSTTPDPLVDAKTQTAEQVCFGMVSFINPVLPPHQLA